MRCTKRTPIDDDEENAVIRPLEACESLSTEGSVNLAKKCYFGDTDTSVLLRVYHLNKWNCKF